MKKVLLLLGNELAAYQMLTYLKQNNHKYALNAIIQDQYFQYKFKKKKIFFDLKPYLKKYIIINNIGIPVFFSFLKIFNYFKRYQNKINYQEITNLIKKKNYNIDQYDEVWFSNENIAAYILHRSNCKKIFFSHSALDSSILYKGNFFFNLKKKIEGYINNRFMFIYMKNNNFLYKSIFSNFFLKKKKDFSISQKIFIKLFKKNQNLKKKNCNYDCNLINFAALHPNYSIGVENNFLHKKYLRFFFDNILSKIFKKTNTKDINLVKFRDYVPLSFQKKIIKLILKKFPDKKIILVNDIFPEFDTLEKVFINFNVKKFFSTFSSSVFFGKILNEKIVIYDYSKILREFWEKNYKYLKKKNNYNNYPRALKFYKKVSFEL